MVTLELGLVVQTEEKQALKRLGRKRFGGGGGGGGETRYRRVQGQRSDDKPAAEGATGILSNWYCPLIGCHSEKVGGANQMRSFGTELGRGGGERQRCCPVWESDWG